MLANISPYSVYVLKEPDGETVRYVGLTSNYKERIRQHLKCHKKYRVNSWIKSLKLNGLLPISEIIDDAKDLNEARIKEIQYIKLFKSFGAILTNLTDGGEGTKGIKCSEEKKEKIRKKTTLYRHTDEAKKKIGEASKRFMKGKKHSAESIEKTASKLRGRPSWNKGKKMSEEHKEALKTARRSFIDNGGTVWNKNKKNCQIPWNKGTKGLQVAWNKGLTNTK